MAPIVGIADQFEFATVGSPSVYTVLVGVTAIAQTGDKVQIEKTTTMATVNGVDTFVASTQDPGGLDVKGFFLPADATQVALQAIKAAGSTVNMKVLYGSGNSAAFAGIVESFTPNWNTADKLATLDIKIKISGPITYA